MTKKINVDKYNVHVFYHINRKNQLTSLALEPDTSIHVLEKKAHDPNMKNIYNTACIGSSPTCDNVSGGER
jgi:uncharacterized protein (UPF0147 family)